MTCLFATYSYNPRRFVNYLTGLWIDLMDALYAPWRSVYIRSERPGGCIFCEESLRSREFVLWEGNKTYVMMNRYPYSCGHLMVIPSRHLDKLHDLNFKEQQEMFALIDLSLKVLTEIMKPDGFNIGMNLGKVAGAGVDDHIHAHIVPRWNGDTNFMTVTGETRVVSEDLIKTRDALLPCFAKLSLAEV